MIKIIFFLTSLLLLQASVFAGTKISGQSKQQSERTIKSLLIGVNSDNLGLKLSSAYMLGELKVSEAVIPLMKILKNQNDEELKIAAALALYKIGDGRGIYAIKKSVQFEQNERVKKICDLFYKSYKGQKELKTELLSVK